jgi:hypothetical protein
MNHSREFMAELIEHLRGTCKSLAQGCTDFGTDEDLLCQEDLAAIDAEIFLCESCGWWCERSEEKEDEPGVCIECDE